MIKKAKKVLKMFNTYKLFKNDFCKENYTIFFSDGGYKNKL